MNLRARREEEGYVEERDERAGEWIGWPSVVRRVGAVFCVLILFGFVLGLLGLRLRDGLVIAGVTLGGVYAVVRMRRAARRRKRYDIQ